MALLNYVDRIVDGMDINDLCQIVSDYMHDNLESYTDEQLVAEVKDYYPDMIEDENDE